METFKKVLGTERPSTLTSMANLASTYRNQGRWQKAEELGVQAVETSKKVLGSEHPDTLNSITLPLRGRKLGRDAETIKLMDKCVLLRRLSVRC